MGTVHILFMLFCYDGVKGAMHMNISIKQTVSKYRYLVLILVFFSVLTVAITTQNEVPYNRIAIHMGSAHIYWYAIFIMTGILLAVFYARTELENIGYDPNILYDGLIIGLPLAILGARIYYVLFDPMPHYQNFIDVINITRGGLAIHGAIITTVIFVWIYAKKKKIQLSPLLDILVVGLLIGQIVGRFGNFMNHEAYGPMIQSDWVFKVIPNFILIQMTDSGVTHHPTFLYEGLWNLSLVIFLLSIKSKKVFREGDFLGLYLIWYGLGRALIIEPMRIQGAVGDALMFMGLPMNVIMSLIFVIIGIIYLYLKHNLRPKRLYTMNHS